MASLLENKFFDNLNYSDAVKKSIIKALEGLGAEELGDIQYVTDKDLIDKGVKVIPARKLIAYFNKNYKYEQELQKSINTKSLLYTCDTLEKNMHCLSNFVSTLRAGIPRDSPTRMSRLNVLDLAQLTKQDPVLKKRLATSAKLTKGRRKRSRSKSSTITDATAKAIKKQRGKDKKKKREKSPSGESPKCPKFPEFAPTQQDKLGISTKPCRRSVPNLDSYQLSKLSKEFTAEELASTNNAIPHPTMVDDALPKTLSKSELILPQRPVLGACKSPRDLKRQSTETIIALSLNSDSEVSNSSSNEIFVQCDIELNSIQSELNLLLDSHSIENEGESLLNMGALELQKQQQNETTSKTIEPKTTKETEKSPEEQNSCKLETNATIKSPVTGLETTETGKPANTNENVDNKKIEINCGNKSPQSLSPKMKEKKFKYELKQTVLESEEDDEGSDDELEEEDDESDEERIIPSCSLMEYDVIIHDKKTALEVIYSICKLSYQLNEMIGGAICPANSNIVNIGPDKWQVKVKWALPMENFALPSAPDPNELAIWLLEVLPPVDPDEMAARRGIFVDLDWSIFSNLSKQAIAAHK